MQFSLLTLPKTFDLALSRWRAARMSSLDTKQQLLGELQKITDEATNLYLVDLRPDSADKFGFYVAQHSFDFGTELRPDDVLGSEPDKAYLVSDVFPNYLHVATSGEANATRMMSNLSGRLAQYERLILPISAGAEIAPDFAISLSRLRLRVDPGDGSGKELSPKELAVLNAAAQGMTVKETARELGSSPRTVEAQLDSVRRKLGAKNIAHAVAIFVLMSAF